MKTKNLDKIWVSQLVGTISKSDTMSSLRLLLRSVIRRGADGDLLVISVCFFIDRLITLLAIISLFSAFF